MFKKLFYFNRLPPYLIFFITSRCNMRCQHCFFWQDINSQAQELTQDEIEKVARSLPGLLFMRITGGEPFLRLDIADIIGAFYKFSGLRRIGINTNGFLTAQIVESVKKMLKEFKGLDLEVGISFDGLEERHDNIRQCPGAFKNALATFSALKELKKDFANLKLGFLVTLMKDNQDEFEPLFKFLASLNPDNIGLNLVRGEPVEARELEVDIEKYRNVLALINAFNQQRSSGNSWFAALRVAKTRLSQRIIIRIVKDKIRQIKCNAASKIAVLYADGNVSACESSGYKLGNIRNYRYSFMDLWRSDARKKVISEIEKRKCFCTHECFITSSLVFEPAGLLKIVGEAFFNRKRS